jgi:hypothetical protein
MFQLIVAVVAILLLVVMGVAAMWYGGNVFTESKQRALYSEYVNSASQIDGAINLFYQEKAGYPAGEDEVFLQNLVSSGYLNGVPNGQWKVSRELLYKSIADVKVCEIINRMSGQDTSTTQCPPCGDAAFKGWPGCTVPE